MQNTTDATRDRCALRKAAVRNTAGATSPSAAGTKTNPHTSASAVPRTNSRTASPPRNHDTNSTMGKESGRTGNATRDGGTNRRRRPFTTLRLCARLDLRGYRTLGIFLVPGLAAVGLMKKASKSDDITHLPQQAAVSPFQLTSTSNIISAFYCDSIVKCCTCCVHATPQHEQRFSFLDISLRYKNISPQHFWGSSYFPFIPHEKYDGYTMGPQTQPFAGSKTVSAHARRTQCQLLLPAPSKAPGEAPRTMAETPTALSPADGPET